MSSLKAKLRENRRDVPAAEQGDPALEALREADAPAAEARPAHAESRTLPATRTERPADAPAAPPKKSRKLRRTLLALGPIVAVAAGIGLYLTGGRFISTDNAYVKMAVLSVTTDVSGIISAIPVHDNERVAKGDILFRMDPATFQIALDSSKAQLQAVRAEVANLQATYRKDQTQIAQAKSNLVYFQKAYDRQVDLSKRHVTSAANLDQAKKNFDAGTQDLAAAQAQAEATLAQLGGNAKGNIEDHPKVKQAQAAVDKAQRDLTRSVVKAPFDGIVTNVSHLQPGAYLQAGAPAFSLVGTDHAWVEASPKETQLTYVKPGDTATVIIDTYPGRSWKATVQSIDPASGAEFSVLPAQNASGNWVKVVQRIPLRLDVEMPKGAPALRAGMSAEIEIDTGHERSFAGLVDTVEGWFGF